MRELGAAEHQTDRGRLPVDEAQADAIRAELARVLESHEFRASKRCQDFLRYVVETSLQGHADQLKERTIGVEVFGRPASYDPGTDATVRVKAGEVRRRLAAYYAGNGAGNELHIVIPQGGYLPEFCPVNPPGSASAEAVSVTATPRRRYLAYLVPLLALTVAIAGYRWWHASANQTVLRQFWSPALQSGSPVLLCVAYVPVYGLDPQAQAKSEAVRTGADYALLPDSFIGGGDLLAVSHLSNMLNSMGHEHQVKLGSDVSFHDLRTSPSALIGYSYTRWKELSQGPRFLLDTDKYPNTVTDNGKPTGWKVTSIKRDRSTDEDYAIVSRLFHPDTGNMLLILAGFTQFGTEAASDLVTNEAELEQALRAAPKDWATKNLQLVIHVKVISGAAGSPRVVAAHYW